jgi:pyrroloquinoline quinone biosynthesis protein B
MRLYFLFILTLFLSSFESSVKKTDEISPITETSLIILGTVQDGGSPHVGCKKNCCKELFMHPERRRDVVSLGVIDPQNQKKYMFECTPDFPFQAKDLLMHSSFSKTEMPDGIFLTHAHIGHYSGLMYLGKEATNADSVKVYAMPKMKQFLENNGPWSQLVNNKNIILNPIFNNQEVKLTSNVAVTPIIVPHRDEYSETVGFIIEGPSKKILFIPDIDKWEKWDKDIIKMIASVDLAFIDGTFYNGEEINSRNIATIPHPFIIESMNLFKDLPAKEKDKIYFIHFNHTNLALDLESKPAKSIIENGFHIAQKNQVIKL